MKTYPPSTLELARLLLSAIRDQVAAQVVALGFMIASSRSAARWRIAFRKGSGQPVPDELYWRAGERWEHDQ